MDTISQIADDPKIIITLLSVIAALIQYAIFKLRRVEKNQGKLFDEHKRIRDEQAATNKELTELKTEHNIYCCKCKHKNHIHHKVVKK